MFKMIFIFSIIVIFCTLEISSEESTRLPHVIDERWICLVKRNCIDCLRFPHCSWCGSENKCFTASIPGFEDYCKDNITVYTDLGLSLVDNAVCACEGDRVVRRCRPRDADAEAPDCSGRGRCICGQCFCDSLPAEDNLTKSIVGEFCEYDNFSCDGPYCNEGPYHVNDNYETVRIAYSAKIESEDSLVKSEPDDVAENDS